MDDSLLENPFMLFSDDDDTWDDDEDDDTWDDDEDDDTHHYNDEDDADDLDLPYSDED